MVKFLTKKWKVISRKIKENNVLIGVLLILATPYIILNCIYPGFLGNGTITYKDKIYTWITYDTNWYIDYETIGTEVKVHIDGIIGKYSATLYEGGDFIRLEHTGDLYYRPDMEFPEYDNADNIEKIVIQVYNQDKGYKDIILEGEEINSLLEDIKTFDEKKEYIKVEDKNEIGNVMIYYYNFPAYLNVGYIYKTPNGKIGLYKWEGTRKKAPYIELSNQNLWKEL